ncbi:MAG: hypothetical protein H7062_19575 [Candidatus Saccharimonas sp.]|nr:hypothetical protein [Planctomycetaceae bacterium]
MPQMVTLSITAKFEKGPDLKSEAKVDVGSYAGLVEEQLCKCSKRTFFLPTIEDKYIEALIIAADKYKADKECPPLNGSTATIKRVKWGFEGETPVELTRPQILCSKGLKSVTFDNEMTEDVKVSVLAILKTEPSDGAAAGKCCDKK